MSGDQVGGQGALQTVLRIECYTDRPGICRIMYGDAVLFEHDIAEPVTHIAVRTQVPFHTHFENATFALLWRDPS